MDSIYWLIALAVFLVIEIITLGLTTIWFAGGALIAFFAAMFNFSTGIQFVLFFVVSFLLLFFTRPVALKKFNQNRVRTNYEDLIGREAKVTELIDNFNETGRAQVNGQEWTARSADDTKIAADTKVVIKKVTGVKLIVSENREEI